jgi:hypothetical protein
MPDHLPRIHDFVKPLLIDGAGLERRLLQAQIFVVGLVRDRERLAIADNRAERGHRISERPSISSMCLRLSRVPSTVKGRNLSQASARMPADIETGIDKLARQISTTIDWAACLESCRSAGAERALELGPGAALSHMASVLFPDGRACAVEDFHTLAGLRTWLRRAMA